MSGDQILQIYIYHLFLLYLHAFTENDMIEISIIVS